MRRDDYNPRRDSPFRTHPGRSPQYTGGPHTGGPHTGGPHTRPDAAASRPTGNSSAPQPVEYASPPDAGGVELRPSTLGAASLFLGLFSGAALIGLTAAIGMTANRGTSTSSPAMIAMGLGIIAALIGILLGALLGLIAVLQHGRRKGVAIAGLLVNGLLLLAVLGMVLIARVA